MRSSSLVPCAQDFMVALRKTMVTFDDWLLTAMRWDVKELPYRFEHRGSGVVELIKSSTKEAVSDAEVAAFGRVCIPVVLMF